MSERVGTPLAIIFHGETEDECCEQFNKFMREHTNVEVRGVDQHYDDIRNEERTMYDPSAGGNPVIVTRKVYEKPYWILHYTEYEPSASDRNRKNGIAG